MGGVVVSAKWESEHQVKWDKETVNYMFEKVNLEQSNFWENSTSSKQIIT